MLLTSYRHQVRAKANALHSRSTYSRNKVIYKAIWTIKRIELNIKDRKPWSYCKMEELRCKNGFNRNEFNQPFKYLYFT